MTTPSVETADPSKSGDRDRIADDIERTREELSETVTALTQRLDVKSRMKAKAARGSEQAKARPTVSAAVAVSLIALVIGIVVWKRRA